MSTRRISTHAKLLGVAAMLLSFSAIIAMVGLSSLASVEEVAEETYTASTLPLEKLGVARAKANENRALLNNHILASSPAEMAALEQSIATNEVLIEEQFREVEPTLQTNAGKAAFSAIERHLADYSSLAYLKHLPVEELKIDKSFVLEMTTSREDTSIVRSTIDMGRNLGLRVVAEGVETAEHWEQLRRLGCHAAQGYHLSRPLPGDELTAWLMDRPARELATPGSLRN